MWFAAVYAAHFQCAAQRTDWQVIGRAKTHVFAFEVVLANTALDGFDVVQTYIFRQTRQLFWRHVRHQQVQFRRGTCQVIATTGKPGNQGNGDKADRQTDEMAERRQRLAKDTEIAQYSHGAGQQHGPGSNGIDVVQMRSFEFNDVWA